MTLSHPALRRGSSVTPLGVADLARLAAALDADPIVNALVAARLQAARSLAPRRIGGTVYAVSDESGVRGGCFSGGNLIPFGGDAQSWRELADSLAAQRRVCSSIVGRADAIAAMWPILQPSWGAPRAIRACQPLLVTSAAPRVATDTSLRPVRMCEIDRYFTAAAAMFTEELGLSPFDHTRAGAFRARVEGLIRSRRALACFDRHGEVVFKADLPVVTRHTCQIQGVWVRPNLRGRGIGTATMAHVLQRALTLAPTASLYVNDFNDVAHRMYSNLGMQEHAILSTILY